MAMFESTAILLAAGLSTRMGARNKLLLPINGTALVRHVVDTYATVIDGPLLVVLGHEAGSVTEALKGSRAETVFNPHFADGQYTSVAAGLKQAADARQLVIGLCDQPLLRSQDIAALMHAHRATDPSKISVPVRGASRGNPIVVPRALRTHLLEDPKTPGCRKFIQTHSEQVQQLAFSSDGYFFDIDTPEAYAAFLNSMQEPAG